METTFLKFFVAVYSPTVQLTAPSRAWSEGSTIRFDIPNTAEIMMPLIISATLVVSLGAYLAERRFVRPIRYKKKRT